MHRVRAVLHQVLDEKDGLSKEAYLMMSRESHRRYHYLRYCLSHDEEVISKCLELFWIVHHGQRGDLLQGTVYYSDCRRSQLQCQLWNWILAVECMSL
ncbi:MAG: hypothetical protein ACE5IT_09535 [bacterium]